MTKILIALAVIAICLVAAIIETCFAALITPEDDPGQNDTDEENDHAKD
jgi:hypothetical protein